MKIQIEQPHGYLFDSGGRVCIRFANWTTGQRDVPDYVDGDRQPEYVGGPAAHQKPVADKYRHGPL